MKFLADENFHHCVVVDLRKAGFDVTESSQVAHGEDDEVVMRRSLDSDRILLTDDKDFGELSIRRSLPCVGVVLFRLGRLSSDAERSLMTRVLTSRDDWEGFLSVVTPNDIRRRPLPKQP
jgi:predicted nuclease of predicted toxin-antitoxin system